ncbi:MAG: histone deacetylase [Anaerolineae bacterium]|nr:histone deacetylase [Anaerolineae bacterium]
MKVGYVYDPIYLEHDTGDHPERKERLLAILTRLKEEGLWERLVPLQAQEAPLEDLARIHQRVLIDRVRRLAEHGGGYLDADTPLGARSFQVARWAAGGAIAATRAVLSGQVQSAYALVRPPGHHATPSRSMGFCLFNNVAVAAGWALNQGGLSRVAIIDFDVHHGNGTQEAFETDPRVLYVSTHQYPFYPGTGHWQDWGKGLGEGTCLNIPLPAYTGDEGYKGAYERLVFPKVRMFHPELILVSAGYDAHWADPLAWMLLSFEGYRFIIEGIRSLAEELCAGRLVFVLEGGYDLQVLSYGVSLTFAILLGLPYADPLGPAGRRESPVGDLLEQIARWHGLP